ncbi:aminotransferase [Lentinula aciculospora]|uniref:Aminotransferase n=1 Tax=Lentinula aciculospora TaxID=153920 RepID=A0A9W9ANS0_9AGAR|nr:aminotransferase [Lentinula aciculospora]
MYYSLLSSTRYDESLLKCGWNNDIDGPSPFFLLPFHFDRLREASEQHDWQGANTLSYTMLKEKCRQKVEQEGHTQAVKVRITLSEAGEIEVTVSAVASFQSDPMGLVHFNPMLDIPPDDNSIVAVHIDSMSTPSSLFTRTKTTNRALYDEARTRAKISSSTSEVVLFNDDSSITEASISNVSFFRAGRWLTPSASTGCLPGVLRRWLLQKGLIDEDHGEQLTVNRILEGDWVLLSNGVQGCRLGRIALIP